MIKKLEEIKNRYKDGYTKDSIKVPVENYWNLSLEQNLEEIGSVGKYKDLPRIVKRDLSMAIFQKAGHRMGLFFSTRATFPRFWDGYFKPFVSTNV